MGVFNFGSMLGAFKGTPKYKSIFLPYDPEVRKQTVSQLDTLGKDQALDSDIFSTLRARNEGLGNQYAEDSQSFASLLKSMAGQGTDPYAGYERLRSGNLGALDKWKTNLMDYGSAYDKLAGARVGNGGSPGSSYMSILNQDRAGRNISPILSQIFGNLGRDTATLEGSSLADKMFRTQLPQRSLDLLAGSNELPLREMAARTKSRGLGAAILDALENISKSNSARGTQRIRTGLDRWSDFGKAADEGLNSALDLVMSMYGGGSGGLLSGLMGGGKGGGKGGGGGTADGFAGLGPNWA